MVLSAQENSSFPPGMLPRSPFPCSFQMFASLLFFVEALSAFLPSRQTVLQMVLAPSCLVQYCTLKGLFQRAAASQEDP